MSGFDWPLLMAAGLRGLRLQPEAFWRLTPAELRLLLGEAAQAGSLRRAGLEALLAAYPDVQAEKEPEDG
ncbi:rcc01693 family protein [Pseudooceanicola sp.]|uniref:rcc01693 family protein n=1 Tax=Pseudooceanicola sp. TaxID=1914328 RepID=UPI00260DCC77|nr:rcc01693 family protein [Pseudooceanicola sp.]MDF1854908.1 phage tail assembly chaperone [Pseudooceanicola sp.]